MSLPLALARIEQIERALVPQLAAAPAASAIAGAGAPASAAAAPTASASFASLLGNASGSPMTTIAAAEVGQAEQPPGSNDSPRIAQYRSATAGAPGPGPWCAYFTSWVARQAGAPLGDQGQGFGSVDALYSWAQQSGRAYQAGSGRTPQPGDLIVFNEHIGLVEGVDASGQIHTIEGNSSDQVSRRVHSASEAIGFVRMS